MCVCVCVGGGAKLRSMLIPSTAMIKDHGAIMNLSTIWSRAGGAIAFFQTLSSLVLLEKIKTSFERRNVRFIGWVGRDDLAKGNRSCVAMTRQPRIFLWLIQGAIMLAGAGRRGSMNFMTEYCFPLRYRGMTATS